MRYTLDTNIRGSVLRSRAPIGATDMMIGGHTPAAKRRRW